MAAASIAASAITVLGSARASDTDASLAYMDFWAEDTFETGDWITAATLGVSGIRGIVGVSAVANGGADWATAVSTGDVDLQCERRARAAMNNAGSTANSAAASSDADRITLGSAFNTLPAIWVQLLVEI